MNWLYKKGFLINSVISNFFLKILRKNYDLNYNYSKYKFKRLLTKGPSKTSSLEYIIITSYTYPSFITLTHVSVWD